MKTIEITKVENGYIVESNQMPYRFQKVFATFSEAVRELEIQFHVRLTETSNTIG